MGKTYRNSDKGLVKESRKRYNTQQAQGYESDIEDIGGNAEQLRRREMDREFKLKNQQLGSWF